MDWDDTKELAEFRATIRAFFEEKLPERYKRQAEGEYMRQSVPGPDGMTAAWRDPTTRWNLTTRRDPSGRGPPTNACQALARFSRLRPGDTPLCPAPARPGWSTT